MPEAYKKYLQSAYEYFHRLNITFYLFIAVPLVAFCYAYLQQQAQGGLLATHRLPLLHIVIILGTVCSGVFALVWYRQALQELDTSTPFQEKLRYFHQKNHGFYLFFTLANIIPTIGLYLTGEQLFAGIYAIALVVFALYRPTPRRISRDLRLSQHEEKKLVSDQPYDGTVTSNEENEDKDLQ